MKQNRGYSPIIVPTSKATPLNKPTLLFKFTGVSVTTTDGDRRLSPDFSSSPEFWADLCRTGMEPSAIH